MKILIVGASGYLGSMLYKRCAMSKNIELYGTYCSMPGNKSMLKLDIQETENVQNMVKSIAPDVIIWSIKNEEDERNISEFGLANILSTISENVRFIYISTLVSSISNQNEDVLPEPLSLEMYHANYVNGKIRGEELVKIHKNHVIIRPGQIFGFGADGQPDTRMKRILDRKKAGESYPRAANSYISIVHINDLTSCIIELCYNNFMGIIHIAADQPISYYVFYKILASMLEMDDEIIVPYFEEIPTNAFFNVTKCKMILSTRIRNFELNCQK